MEGSSVEEAKYGTGAFALVLPHYRYLIVDRLFNIPARPAGLRYTFLANSYWEFFMTYFWGIIDWRRTRNNNLCIMFFG